MLFEMVVTVLLLGIVLAMVYEGIGSLSVAFEGTQRRLQNLDEARVLMASSSKDLRTATSIQAGTSPFTAALPADVTFFANIDNPAAAASKIHLYVDPGTELVEDLYPATDDTGTTPCTQQPCSYLDLKKRTRFVGRYITNNDVFTYLDVSGAPLTPVPPATVLSAAQLLQIRTVAIKLAVKKATTFPIGTTELHNTVGLPNVVFQQTS